MFPADVARASTVRFNGYKACQQTDTSKLFTVVTEKQNGDVALTTGEKRLIKRFLKPTTEQRHPPGE